MSEGRLPDAAIACVGGGSNAIGLFHAFLADANVRLIGCEAAGHGVASGKHAATLAAGVPGILHGSRSYVLQDDEGQIAEPYSISAGLDYPGIGPEHAYLHDVGRGEYRPITDAAAMRAFRLLASTEGIIPALESAHALAGALEVGPELGPDGLILVNLSGRGDKDLDIAARYFEQEAGALAARGGVAKVSGNLHLLADAMAAARQENRAALITYLPAGFPTVDGGIAAVVATLNSGADIVEVGLPYSDPVLDGPVIQTADDIALRGGVRISDAIRTVREADQATGKPVVIMSYWNPVAAYGVERFASELAAAGGAGCILTDLPVQESGPWRRSAARHGLATIFLVAPSTTDARLREITAAGSGFVYASSLMGVTGAREAVSAAASSLVRRVRAVTELPVCVGIGISNGAQAAEVAGFADGVIVGTAMVKAVLDAPNAAAGIAAVRKLTAELALSARRQI